MVVIDQVIRVTLRWKHRVMCNEQMPAGLIEYDDKEVNAALAYYGVRGQQVYDALAGQAYQRDTNPY